MGVDKKKILCYFRLMMLDRYQCELLDVVLGAFGNGDSLSRESLLDLFGQDEAMAAAMFDVLAVVGWVREGAPEKEHPLLMLITGEKQAFFFLKNGGYPRRYEEAAA